MVDQAGNWWHIRWRRGQLMWHPGVPQIKKMGLCEMNSKMVVVMFGAAPYERKAKKNKKRKKRRTTKTAKKRENVSDPIYTNPIKNLPHLEDLASFCSKKLFAAPFVALISQATHLLFNRSLAAHLLRQGGGLLMASGAWMSVQQACLSQVLSAPREVQLLCPLRCFWATPFLSLKTPQQ